jgi:hypothetical protein
MNSNQVVSIVVKALLSLSGVMLALGWMTPEQVASLQDALNGVPGLVAEVIAVVVAIYSAIRSIKTHK